MERGFPAAARMASFAADGASGEYHKHQPAWRSGSGRAGTKDSLCSSARVGVHLPTIHGIWSKLLLDATGCGC